MRDTQKMKDKVEVSLEGRHLFSLSMVFFLAVAAAFWLGIGVGKKLERGNTNTPEPDLLAQLDAQKPPAPQPLTFQEELTRKPAPVVVEKPAPKPVEKPVEKIAEKPVEKPAEPVAQKQTLEQALQKVAEKPREPAIPAEPLQPGDKVVEAIPQPTVELKPEPKPAPAPVVVAPKPAPAPAEALTNTRSPDAGGAMKDAFARAARPEKTAPDGQWTIQISAYQDKAEAERNLAGLRDRGYAPYIVEAKVPNKGTWFRVRMGRFASREAAARYLSDFQRETQISAIVAPVN
jgi:cell division septation protein DedD